MTRLAIRITIAAACLATLSATASAASPPMPTFFARRDYTTLISYWVQVADTNGDGIPDLIGNEIGAIQVLFGNGDGTFRSGPSSLTQTAANSFVAVDFTGDGKIDLVMAGLSNDTSLPTGIGISPGNGDGTFQEGTFLQVGNGKGIGNVVVGDFNGDGILDIAVTAPEGVWLFTGKGGGALNPGVLAVSLTGA